MKSDKMENSNEILCMYQGCNEVASKNVNVFLSEGVFVTVHYCPAHSWEWE
jgi:hypothetical protein